MTSLRQECDTLHNLDVIKKEIPEYVTDNLNPAFQLRPYQIEAISRFIYYLEEYPRRIKPSQLLFHMATGSGKTLLMAANILYLYNKGYRNFLFFVNSTNIIEKTRDNFLNPGSRKYLFNTNIQIGDKRVEIKEVSNFEASNKDNINILFTTIQGLHSAMTTPRENSITYEDLKEKNIVIVSDEAHHINSWTKNKLNRDEAEMKKTWENTVMNTLNSNSANIMLEYTATLDIDNKEISEKYYNKIIYEYALKQFRQEGYSKEVKVLQSDVPDMKRAIQAVILSQYRRKIAEKNGLHLKPVILFKSKSIKESKEFSELFNKKVKELATTDIEQIRRISSGNILEKAFSYFSRNKITDSHLVKELKEDFSEEKCLLLDSKNISEEKQLQVNSLEDTNNEIRSIFAVDMLNEGWDVLNLFDIVRLYNTRDAEKNRPGKTTISEAQLIGRGARYFPFRLDKKQDRFKRKFDQMPDSDLKTLEELYYHSAHNPKYIQELTVALRETGIMPPKEPKTIQLTLKNSFKNTDLWKKGLIFLNEKKEADRSNLRDIRDINVNKIYKFSLETGYTWERAVFLQKQSQQLERVEKILKLSSFRGEVLRKAIAKADFYRFDNLKRYFPKLETMDDFLRSLKNLQVEISSSEERLQQINMEDKLLIAISVLSQLEQEIKTTFVDYVGTERFVQNRLNEIVTDKVMKLNIGDIQDQEYGIAMSETPKEDLRLDLADKDWYIYDENYGTSEEKHFVRFINSEMKKLTERYDEVYLLRNADLFKIYRFYDGKAIEPDFILLLRDKNKKKILQYQIFIEVKGTHLLATDKWKEEFLKEVESRYKIEILAENKEFRIIGLPFYNEDNKLEFIQSFREKLELEQ